jgi:uncharacterized protein YqkB
MKSLVTAIVLFASFSSFSQDVFVIKKNMNPKNELRFKAEVASCKLKTPAVSAYWLMGEEEGHKEGLTSNEKPYFEPKISFTNSVDADFTIGAMEKMGKKLPDQSIKVRLENCKPKAFLEVEGQEIQITEIFVQVNMLMSVKYMNISGIAPNGQKISHKIE